MPRTVLGVVQGGMSVESLDLDPLAQPVLRVLTAFPHLSQYSPFAPEPLNRLHAERRPTAALARRLLAGAAYITTSSSSLLLCAVSSSIDLRHSLVQVYWSIEFDGEAE